MAARYALMLITFAVTLFTSATLLFLVQPMVGKMTLPLLGGTPAVWNTCMVFFQAALLAGYAYAHASVHWLGVRRQSLVHMGVLLLPLVLFMLPISIDKDWAPSGDENPVPQVLWMLTATVGVPFFVVSTTAPLIQKWFAATDHPQAADPYFLYAASNIGSMLALFGYPLLIEPNWPLNNPGLRDQTGYWTIGYVVLVVLIGLCALLLWRSPVSAMERERTAPRATPDVAAPRGDERGGGKGKRKRGSGGASPASSTAPRPVAVIPAADPDAPHPERPTIWRKLYWIALAFVPSSLMLGVTTHITTDIAAIPLLWVLPLGLYLLSFIIVFARMPRFFHTAMVLLMPPLLLVLLFQTLSELEPAFLTTWMKIVLHLLVLFMVAMVCHGELAQNRPPTRYLTEFFLLMSVGGVLGGAFNALVAPVVFDHLLEYPIALVLACLLMPRPFGRPRALPPGGFDVGAPSGSASAAGGGRRTPPPLPADGPPPSDASIAIARVLDIVLPLAIGGLALRLVMWRTAAPDTLRSFTQTANRWGLTVDELWLVVVYGLPLALCWLLAWRPVRFGAAVAAVLICVFIGRQIDVEDPTIYRTRTFFGVLTVDDDTEWGVEGRGDRKPIFVKLMHGTTTHGLQNRSSKAKRLEPLTYYHRRGPVGQIVKAFEDAGKPVSNFAVIGLGTGSMAAYADGPGKKLTFYEIDAAVRDIAENPDYFTYVTDARDRGAQVDIVMGDARLRMADYPPDHEYDLIVVDAFSSDAIPVHLITREAVALLMSKLADGGVVAYHISNRYLDLQPVLANFTKDLDLRRETGGLVALRQWDEADDEDGKYASDWVILARDPSHFGPMLTNGRWHPLEARPEVGVWTDDYSNLLTVFTEFNEPEEEVEVEEEVEE